MNPSPKIVVDAIRFAAQKHQGQMRKDGRTPYVSHPYRVMFHLISAGVADPDTLAAAVLHDTIEDTTADFDDLEKRFGKKVATFVSFLSKDKRKPDEERENEYFDLLEKAPLPVKLCKLGDAYDNLIDAVHLPAEGAAKAADKAERLLGIFKDKIPAEYVHMMVWVEDAVEALRETKALAADIKPTPKLETRQRKKKS